MEDAKNEDMKWVVATVICDMMTASDYHPPTTYHLSPLPTSAKSLYSVSYKKMRGKNIYTPVLST